MKSLRALAEKVTTPWDVALMLGFATFAVLETLTVTDAPMPAMRAALAAATMAGLALRRRMPLTAAAMVAFGLASESIFLESADEISVLLGVVVAAFSVAAYAPLRDALVGVALLSMAIAVAISLDPSDSASNIVPTLLLFVVVPQVLGVTVHRRQQQVAVLQLETEALTREAEAAVDAERLRIARELHDVVSHAVTPIAVQAEAGQAVIDRDPTGMARLSALLEGARAAGLTVTVQEEGVRRPLPAAADHCAYRGIQEGLTNALRHASGANVTVLFRYDTDEVRIRVDSQGKRHSSAYGSTGRGLVGLRERVLGLGGTLEADPTPSGDFGLRATLPAAAL